MANLNLKRTAALACCLAVLMAGSASAQTRGFGLIAPRNTATVTQVGAGNGGAIVQNGAANQAGLAQYGQSNTGQIRQDGVNNNACLVQVGNGLNGAITQNGANQNLGVLQTNSGARQVSTRLCTDSRQGVGPAAMFHRLAPSLFN